MKKSIGIILFLLASFGLARFILSEDLTGNLFLIDSNGNGVQINGSCQGSPCNQGLFFAIPNKTDSYPTFRFMPSNPFLTTTSGSLEFSMDDQNIWSNPRLFLFQGENGTRQTFYIYSSYKDTITLAGQPSGNALDLSIGAGNDAWYQLDPSLKIYADNKTVGTKNLFPLQAGCRIPNGVFGCVGQKYSIGNSTARYNSTFSDYYYGNYTILYANSTVVNCNAGLDGAIGYLNVGGIKSHYACNTTQWNKLY